MNDLSICCASEKGGVGKTSISYSVSKDLGFKYVTNDMSSNVSEYGKYYSNIKKVEGNAIYDLGGFKDKEANKLIEESDLLIIPTIAEINSIMKSVSMARRFKDKTNVIFLVNRVRDDRDIARMTKIHKETLPWTKLMFMKETKLFQNAYEEKVGIKTFYKKNKLNLHVYKNAYKDYKIILNEVKKYEQNI